MIDEGKKNVLGLLVNAIDYDAATESILAAACVQRPFIASALAVHGVMCGFDDLVHKFRLNHFNLVTPDGQPVRWAMWVTGQANLPDRVYGPFLTLRVCERAAAEGLSIFLFGASEPTLTKLVTALRERFPTLKIAGQRPSRFRQITEAERDDDVQCICASGANLVMVGLGCPRQEVWAYEMRERLGRPILAVGAAFDFLGGTQAMAPAWMQRAGLEWLFRLIHEPARLWRRYLILNPRFCFALLRQCLRFGRFDPKDCREPAEELRFG
ncbi:MAG: WecB/TagA/CpsF family glycosyltransferase [Verrucomicrobia bacterium]|nr:WecB/TagA/CpsF family glycosyltransferase [Verrucomicrobiota bacterium]